tara:strand:+ start:1482 stop:2057 length:576 start_codon:yes stop_codon:yes gene_type:complete
MKNLIKNTSNIFHPCRQTVLMLLAITVSACTVHQAPSTSGIGFREQRFADLAAMREFRDCRDEGMKLDRHAAASGSPGTYLTSARVLEQCEKEIGPDQVNVGTEERMQAYALAIQNYFKGRDISSAKDRLKKFKTKFPGHDFYYPDGSSFILTMETLMGMKDRISYGQFSALNVNKALKSEMRRMHYWKKK